MIFEDPIDVQDPIDDDDILAAWGRAVRNGLIVGLAPPTAQAQRATIQSILDSTDTGIAADVLTYDSHSMHTIVGGVSRFVVPPGCAGGFDVGMNVNWQSNNVNRRSAFIRVTRVATSTTEVIAGVTDPCGFDGYMQQLVTKKVQVLAGDFFEFFVNQNCGAALNLEPIDEAFQTIWADWYRLPHTIAAA